MVVVLWLIVAVFGVSVAWLSLYLGAIAFKRWLPAEVAVVDGITLGESRLPRLQQVFLTIRYHTPEGDGAVRLLFCRSNRMAVERSRRLQRLKDFYRPGREFRLYRIPFGGRSGLIPECPVLRVETLILLSAIWCCGGVLVGALMAIYLRSAPDAEAATARQAAGRACLQASTTQDAARAGSRRSHSRLTTA